jgi:hypothetical protein
MERSRRKGFNLKRWKTAWIVRAETKLRKLNDTSEESLCIELHPLSGPVAEKQLRSRE